MKIKTISIPNVTLITLFLFVFAVTNIKAQAEQQPTLISKAQTPVMIDGVANEADWETAAWVPIDKMILGISPTADDFSGRYKLLWDQQYLYIFAEIYDDVLFDQHKNPLKKYWDDDCLEIFVDEDRSGGDHQFNFNAFAYHVALDNQAVDIGPNNPDGSTNFILLSDHINSSWQIVQKAPQKIHWEVAVKIYDDSFALQSTENQPVKLSADKQMGFMLAYCDNDGSEFRESFVGDVAIPPKNGDKNLGYIDAGVFAPVILIDR